MLPKNRRKKAQGKNFKIFHRASHSPLRSLPPSRRYLDLEREKNDSKSITTPSSCSARDFVDAIVNFFHIISQIISELIKITEIMILR